MSVRDWTLDRRRSVTNVSRMWAETQEALLPRSTATGNGSMKWRERSGPSPGPCAITGLLEINKTQTDKSICPRGLVGYGLIASPFLHHCLFWQRITLWVRWLRNQPRQYSARRRHASIMEDTRYVERISTLVKNETCWGVTLLSLWAIHIVAHLFWGAPVCAGLDALRTCCILVLHVRGRSQHLKKQTL